MRAILSKVLIFGSLRGAFFMDVKEADRKTGNGGGTTGREKLRNRRKAVRRADGKSGQRRPGGRRTAAEVDNLPAALKVFAQGYIMMRNWATILTI